MAEEYSKISQLPQKLYDEITGSEDVPLRIGTGNGRISITEFIKNILGIGIGTSARSVGQDENESIVTTTAVQEISDKDFVNNKLNGVSILSSITGATLNFLDGLASNLVTQLLAITNRLSLLESKTVTSVTNIYYEKFTISGGATTKTITAKELMDFVSIESTLFGIIPESLSIQLYQDNTTDLTKMDEPGNFTINIDSGYVDDIVLDSLPSSNYAINIIFMVEAI